jgi:hypothetical protein
MPELVRVDEASVCAVEAFLSEVVGEQVLLGRVWLAPGRAGALVGRLARASGITLGQIVFLGPTAGRRWRAGEPGEIDLDRLGTLLVHECVHVWQSRRDGTARFLARYIYFYCTNIIGFSRARATRGWSRRMLQLAYRAIPFEVEAFSLAERWRAGDSACRSRTLVR